MCGCVYVCAWLCVRERVCVFERACLRALVHMCDSVFVRVYMCPCILCVRI